MGRAKGSTLSVLARKILNHSHLTYDDVEAILILPYERTTVQKAGLLSRDYSNARFVSVLLSGMGFRQRFTRRGERQILSFHMAGDLLGLRDVVGSGLTDDARAIDVVELAVIPRQTIDRLAAERPNVAAALLNDTFVNVAIAEQWLCNLASGSARQRLAHLICELARRQDAAGLGDGRQYHWPMIQEVVADAIGLTAVHVNRTMQALRGERLISQSAQKLVIHDWPALRAAADFSEAYLSLGNVAPSAIPPAQSTKASTYDVGGVQPI